MLKIELSNVITKTELGEITYNQNENILNRIAKLNLQVDISQVKIQENIITDNVASIGSIYKIYTDNTVKVAFTIGKKPSNINDTKKIITEDEYKKQGDRPKGSKVVLNQPYNTDNSKAYFGDGQTSIGIQQQTNQYDDVPEDHSCLFWAVATAHLWPVRNNNQEFKNRFIQLFGEGNLKKLWYQNQIAK